MNNTTTVTENKAAVYVGTYGKYNSGSLEGAWLTLSDYADKAEFIAACTLLHDDEDAELMFQDYENIPECFIGESWISESYWTYLDLTADMSEDELEALTVFIANGSHNVSEDTEGALETFKEAYQGQYDSMLAFAEQSIEDGMLGEIPAHLAQYIDADRYARDLENDFWYSGGHVFRNI
jgi:antirestriction protein